MALFRTTTLALLLLSSAPAWSTDLTIRVMSIDAERKGKLLVQLCESKDFLVRDCRFQQIKDVKAGVETVVFKGVPEGMWGAMAFHDENNNGKLDTDKLGIPVEGTGFSRNAKGQYGPPTFGSAAEKISGPRMESKFRLTY